MTTAEIESLLEQVRRATGPDRELDSDLGFALGWYAKGCDFYAWVEADGSFVESVNPKPFTSSMDAAIALIERVLPGWEFFAGNGTDAPWATLSNPADPFREFQAHAATLPITFLAALLLALLHQASDKGTIDA